MIRLITINNPRMAQAFIDYMAAKNVEITMTSDGDGQFSLWLVDDQALSATEPELKEFLNNPGDRKYQAASWEVGDKNHVRFQYVSGSIWASLYHQAGSVTLAVMLIGAVIYAISAYLLNADGIPFQEQTLFSLLHFPDDGYEKWQVWRWFTHAFLHFSLMHIVFNMLWWWVFGGRIEKRLGSGVLASIFFISAAGSGLAQYFAEGVNFGGLSGVVYALVGFLWMIGWKKPESGLGIQKPILIFMLIWLVLACVQPFYAIANSAHFAGLIIGMGLGLYEARRI